LLMIFDKLDGDLVEVADGDDYIAARDPFS
jgi:hypothetical protein